MLTDHMQGHETKPVFAMPFPPGQGQYHDNGHMGHDGGPMEKQGSGSQEDDEPKGWQRWFVSRWSRRTIADAAGTDHRSLFRQLPASTITSNLNTTPTVL